MKYFKYSITALLILLISTLAGENHDINSIINKKLNYQLEFRKMKAGKGFIVLENDTLNNESILRLNSKIQTNKFFDFFYKIRNDITIYMDRTDYSLLKVINKIRESEFKKNHTANIDLNLMKIFSEGEEKYIDGRVYSPLSIIFLLRNKLLNLNNEYHYKTYSVGKLKDVNVLIVGEEIIKTKYGTFNTIIASPKSKNNNSILKNNGDMKIWYTNDRNRVPIKIEIKITLGSIVLLLDKIEE